MALALTEEWGGRETHTGKMGAPGSCNGSCRPGPASKPLPRTAAPVPSCLDRFPWAPGKSCPSSSRGHLPLGVRYSLLSDTVSLSLPSFSGCTKPTPSSPPSKRSCIFHSPLPLRPLLLSLPPFPVQPPEGAVYFSTHSCILSFCLHNPKETVLFEATNDLLMAKSRGVFPMLILLA